jgi:hypothetical protein
MFLNISHIIFIIFTFISVPYSVASQTDDAIAFVNEAVLGRNLAM